VLSKGQRLFCLLAFCAVAVPVLGAATFNAATFEELAAGAAAARAADRLPEAIDLYGQALNLKPDWLEGWWYLGTLDYDADRYPEAQTAFARFVQLADKPPGWAFLGLSEFENGEYKQAREHLQKALDAGLPPDIEPAARFHQALLLTRQGLFDQAWHLYKPLVQHGVNNAALIAGLGLNALTKPMLPKEAPGDWQEPIAAAGKAAYAWLSGDNGATDAAFHALLTAYPSAPGVHNFYATYLLIAHPGDAMQEFRRELEVNPQCAEARAMLAILILKSGQSGDAVSLARKAAEDQPASALAQFAYGLTLADPRQAAEHLEIAERLDPSNLECHVALAGAYSKTGRYDDARRERKAAIQLARDSDAK
jgi:tetratricopeptide (TPR) repeat protein